MIGSPPAPSAPSTWSRNAYEPSHRIRALEAVVAAELAEFEQLVGCSIDISGPIEPSRRTAVESKTTECDLADFAGAADSWREQVAHEIASARAVTSHAQAQPAAPSDAPAAAPPARGVMVPLFVAQPGMSADTIRRGDIVNRLQVELDMLAEEVDRLDIDTTLAADGDAVAAVAAEKQAILERRSLLEKAARIILTER